MAPHKTREELRKFINESNGNDFLNIPLEVNEYLEKDAEDNIAVLAESKDTSLNKEGVLQVIKALSESNEDIAEDFMNRLLDKFTEISKEMGVTQ